MSKPSEVYDELLLLLTNQEDEAENTEKKNESESVKDLYYYEKFSNYLFI